MENCLTSTCRCAVCGVESTRHSGWFVVIENTWLDKIRILFWHPGLAEQRQAQSVCGKPHLQALLIHWLLYANLQFPMGTTWRHLDNNWIEHESQPDCRGEFVGELAVQRESSSQSWTGSTEARQSILEALFAGVESKRAMRDAATPELDSRAVPDLAEECFPEYVTQ